MDTTQKLDAYIAEQDEWKQQYLNDFRDLIHSIQPAVAEDIKWGMPNFAVDGKMRISMAAFKDHVKYNFFVKDVTYQDPDKMITSGFDSVNFRAIDIRKGTELDKAKLRELMAQFLK